MERVNLTDKLVGAGALVMALCCAVLPIAAAAVGGGLIAGAGIVGAIVGVGLLVAVVVAVARHRRGGSRC
jgi:hypothetical protein